MATVTKTFTENSTSSYKASWEVKLTGTNQTVSGDFKLSLPTMTAKYTYSGKNAAIVLSSVIVAVGGNTLGASYTRGAYSQGSYSQIATTSGTTYNISASWDLDNSIYLSTLFDSSNPTTKTINVTATAPYGGFESMKMDASMWNAYYSAINFGTIATITLNAPPTFTASATTSAPYYQYASTYTANVSNLSAKYGGSISEVKLIIGSQSATRSGNGTISITPNAAGTFTPQVKVTDSRGQVTTTNLPAITVIGTTVGITSITADRINSSTGLLQDEGTNALVTAVINYTEFAGNYLTQPTLKVGGTETNNVTWYTSWDNTNGFSNAVNWTNYAPTSPVTLYGKVTDTFAQSTSYTISLIGNSTYATSATYTSTLAQAFYLLVGRAGGKGLGIGMKPTGDNLYIGNMNVYLKNTSGWTGFSSIRSDTGTQVILMVGSGGYDHGLYSDVSDNWIIFRKNADQDANDPNSGWYTHIPNAIYVPNAVNIGAQTTTGTNTILCGMTNENKEVFGSTSYTTNLRGSSVQFNGNTMQNMFSTSNHDLSFSTINGGSNSSKTLAITKSGYYPFGIVGYNINSTTGANPSNGNVYKLYLSSRASGSATINAYIANHGSTAMTTPTLTVYVFWVRET